jgi:hypothetical protein
MNEPRRDSPETMRRRELLRRAAWLLGGAVSAPAALAILQGCGRQEPGKPGVRWVPQFLEGREAELVTAIADVMIPKTDTAGALEAGVPAFIDAALLALYPQADQRRFKQGLGQFDEAAKSAGKAFLERDRAAQAAHLKQALEAGLAAEADPKPFILMMRELTLLGYLNSRVGITENMEYVSVPTAFHACVPLSQMKKHVYWE